MNQVNVFDIFKQMNQEDTDNKTSQLCVSPYFISANKVKQGAHITMGVDEQMMYDAFNNKRKMLLLCIDNEAYERIKSELEK